MTYRIDFTPHARHDLAALPEDLKLRVDAKILALADSPRPPGAKKLKGRVNQWRIRVGDYRVVYEIHDKVLLVLVVKIGHLRDVYE